MRFPTYLIIERETGIILHNLPDTLKRDQVIEAAQQWSHNLQMDTSFIWCKSVDDLVRIHNELTAQRVFS